MSPTDRLAFQARCSVRYWLAFTGFVLLVNDAVFIGVGQDWLTWVKTCLALLVFLPVWLLIGRWLSRGEVDPVQLQVELRSVIAADIEAFATDGVEPGQCPGQDLCPCGDRAIASAAEIAIGSFEPPVTEAN